MQGMLGIYEMLTAVVYNFPFSLDLRIRQEYTRTVRNGGVTAKSLRHSWRQLRNR